MTSHDITILTAIIGITVVGIVYVFHGGDGVALTGTTTAIAAFLGFKISEAKNSGTGQ